MSAADSHLADGQGSPPLCVFPAKKLCVATFFLVRLPFILLTRPFLLTDVQYYCTSVPFHGQAAGPRVLSLYQAHAVLTILRKDYET